MEAFNVHTGIIATLNKANVDTDQIIPKQFLKSIKRTGFGPTAFFDWRYVENGDPDPDFELNQARFEARSVLVTRNNFGCGSSREHAVWALHQDGYQVLIAPRAGEGDSLVPGFADIFKNNCLKNGLLAIELSEDEVERIFQFVAAHEGAEATANLPEQTLTVHSGDDGISFTFEVDPGIKKQLVEGLDDIAGSLEFLDEIIAFEQTYDNQLADV